MNNFSVTCPATEQPCTRGCGRRMACTPLGTISSVLTFTAPGVALLLLAAYWFAVAVQQWGMP